MKATMLRKESISMNKGFKLKKTILKSMISKDMVVEVDGGYKSKNSQPSEVKVD